MPQGHRVDGPTLTRAFLTVGAGLALVAVGVVIDRPRWIYSRITAAFGEDA